MFVNCSTRTFFHLMKYKSNTKSFTKKFDLYLVDLIGRLTMKVRKILQRWYILPKSKMKEEKNK